MGVGWSTVDPATIKTHRLKSVLLKDMFELLFKYPRAVFAKGTLVLLGAWPWWVFVLLVLAAGAGLGWLIRSKLPGASTQMKNWRAGVVWLLQFALAALVLLLLWQPALLVAELRPQQNIIAVLLDDSRSMSIADNGGPTREAQAIKALEGGVLDQLQKKFQIRVYWAAARKTTGRIITSTPPTPRSGSTTR